MAVYEVTSPSGEVYEIEGPDDADPSSVIAQITGGQMPRQLKPHEDPNSPTYGQAPTDPSMYDQGDIRRQKLLNATREGARVIGQGMTAMTDGITAIPRAVLNLPSNVINYFGGNAPTIPGLQESVPEFAPKNTAEEYATAVDRALGGMLAFNAAGGLMVNTGNQTAQRIGQSLTTRPGMQTAGAVTGAVSAETAAQMGFGPIGQTIAGLAGGIGPYAATEGAKAVARGGRALVEPFTQQGREQIVGRTLNQVADDPAAAASRMQNAQEIVPGSKPTVAEVSKDYGLIAAQRGAKATNPNEFANRSSQQNTARQQYLEAGAKDSAALTRAIERRESVTSTLRNLAFKQAQGKQIDTATLAQKIDDLISKPQNAGESSQTALKWARAQIEGKTNPEALYAVRKDIAEKIAGKVSAEQSTLRYAGGQLKEINNLIDDAIQDVAPAWKGYLTKYRQLSKPIDRMAALQEAQGKASLAPSDALTSREVLSQAKWKNQVKSLIDLGVLTKGQQQRIQKIAADLDRGMAINDPNIRAIGSNTTQDMTTANVVGQALGSTKMTPFVRSISRPLQWMYKIPEAELQSLLTEAMLDPRMAAALMRKASGANMALVSKLLRERLVGSATGTGAAVATRQSREQENTAQ
jgi:hypothetical protein